MTSGGSPAAPSRSSSLPSSAALPSSPVTSLPFIRRLFVTDPSSVATATGDSLHSFHPSYATRRHSFDTGTIVWTDHHSSYSSHSSSHSSASAASSPAFPSSSLASAPPLTGVNALDLSAASTSAGGSPYTKAPKLLEKLCKFEWDFS